MGGAPAPSRHLVPQPLGLAVLGCFEQLDDGLCRPEIRAYMERECRRIGTREPTPSEYAYLLPPLGGQHRLFCLTPSGFLVTVPHIEA